MTGAELVFLPVGTSLGGPGIGFNPTTGAWTTPEGLPPVQHSALWNGRRDRRLLTAGPQWVQRHAGPRRGVPLRHEAGVAATSLRSALRSAPRDNVAEARVARVDEVDHASPTRSRPSASAQRDPSRRRWRLTARRRSRKSVSSTTKRKIATVRRLKIVPSEKPPPLSDSSSAHCPRRHRRTTRPSSPSPPPSASSSVASWWWTAPRWRSRGAGGEAGDAEARPEAPRTRARFWSAVTARRTGGSVTPVPVMSGADVKPWSSNHEDQPCRPRSTARPPTSCGHCGCRGRRASARRRW